MAPYNKFGQVLTSLRRKYHVSKKEFCSALEINEELLSDIENGNEKPSEEFVEQMISHFSLDDNLAENLWRLAGFSQTEKLEEIIAQTALLPVNELKVPYTDMVHVTVNNYGVVLNFMQHSGPQNQPIVVSRLGMSKEHAKSVIEVLARTLATHNQQDQKKNLLLSDNSETQA
ncbi:helix-turn-helix transcriptional regulator [Candidatus Saccharibacteria bacterium]|nr:helix-turn-helix transcriptional regulator [Candidatus Saccharibacteria bacterium]